MTGPVHICAASSAIRTRSATLTEANAPISAGDRPAGPAFETSARQSSGRSAANSATMFEIRRKWPSPDFPVAQNTMSGAPAVNVWLAAALIWLRRYSAALARRHLRAGQVCAPAARGWQNATRLCQRHNIRYPANSHFIGSSMFLPSKMTGVFSIRAILSGLTFRKLSQSVQIARPDAPESAASAESAKLKPFSALNSASAARPQTGSCARTLAPAASSDFTRSMAGELRRSSVFALNASPQTAKVLPASAPVPPKWCEILSKSMRRCRRFTSETALMRGSAQPLSCAMC